MHTPVLPRTRDAEMHGVADRPLDAPGPMPMRTVSVTVPSRLANAGMETTRARAHRD